MSRNTSSDARLVSKTLGRAFSVQPLASTLLRSTWALLLVFCIAVLSKRASRSLAQTGSWNWCSLSSGMATFGTLKCSKLDPILELILDLILASSWSSSWPPLGAPEGRKHCKNQWVLTLFQISESKTFQSHCILEGLRALGCKMHGRGARNSPEGFKILVFYKVF